MEVSSWLGLGQKEEWKQALLPSSGKISQHPPAPSAPLSKPTEIIVLDEASTARLVGKGMLEPRRRASLDFLLGQLPHESRPSPNHLHYPSRVDNYHDFLKEIEMKGGRLVLDVDNGDEGVEELEVSSDQDEEDIPSSSQLTSTQSQVPPSPILLLIRTNLL
ncbi:uncharacterized protein A4U43_C05F7070 [Asparagus officinalis]|uniref:Uncharacterized protein n=1 Tax=Asparagus officinalis TaxID=4686 RepID=A0A5P1ESH5_ASPOF|nr:uncharacterized protein A4U43_C05F7070 [Asparagus officinalis]